MSFITIIESIWTDFGQFACEHGAKYSPPETFFPIRNSHGVLIKFVLRMRLLLAVTSNVPGVQILDNACIWKTLV